MSEARNEKPSPKPKKSQGALKEALATYKANEEKELFRETRSANCLGMVRIRDFARNAALTTTSDVSHLKTCRLRCAVRVRTMQSEFGTDPSSQFEIRLKAVTNRTDHAERYARELFDRMHGHDEEPERAHLRMWQGTHDLARALRHWHHTGTNEDVKSIVTTVFAAIGAALHDSLTPWAWSFDWSWPVVEMMNEGAAAAAEAGGNAADKFAEGYAAVVTETPIPLKAALVYGLAELAARRDPNLDKMVTSIAARIAASEDWDARFLVAMLIRTETPHLEGQLRSKCFQGLLEDTSAAIRPYVTRFDDDAAKLRKVTHSAAPMSAAVAVIRKSVCDATDEILDNRESVTTVLRLLATRAYIGKVLASAKTTVAGFAFEDITRLIIRRTRRERGQLFLVMQIVAAVRDLQSVANVMTDLLDGSDSDLRQALFVHFVHAYEHTTIQAGANPRFAGEGACRTFEGGAGHPLNAFGERAALLAREDAELLRLVQWSNERLEMLIGAEALFA